MRAPCSYDNIVGKPITLREDDAMREAVAAKGAGSRGGGGGIFGGASENERRRETFMAERAALIQRSEAKLTEYGARTDGRAGPTRYYTADDVSMKDLRPMMQARAAVAGRGSWVIDRLIGCVREGTVMAPERASD